MSEKKVLTFGGERVRIDFNPFQDENVKCIKEQTADLIDRLERMRTCNPSETSRLISLAQTSYEEAAMWAVKAASFNITKESEEIS